MKKFVRSFAFVTVGLMVASCSKKPTTVVESQPNVEGGSEPASTEGGAAAAGAPAGKPGANPLLAGLSEEDRTKFDAWFTRHKLTSDPAVMDRDEDGDGYSNREEFLADTNPRDAKSMPGVMEAASVKEVHEVTIPLVLREVKGGKARVQRTDVEGEEELVVGSQPKGLPYRVTGVKHEVKADKHGVYTDVSNVTLEKAGTKETVVLIRDLPARSSETHAVIVGPTGQEKRVHLDETVEIPGLPGQQFKVIELRGDQVLVEEIGTKRALSIPKR